MLLCMRTTIDINDLLFRAAKRQAAERGTSLREVVEAALRQHLGKVKAAAPYRLQWQTESGRLQPGVDLTDRDALFDIMDGRR
jgi:Arc/MetJ family transcription regulator